MVQPVKQTQLKGVLDMDVADNMRQAEIHKEQGVEWADHIDRKSVV